MTDKAIAKWSDDELLKFIATNGAKEQPSALGEIGPSAVTGAANLASGIAGLPGDIQRLAGSAGNAASRQLTGAELPQSPIGAFPTSGAIKNKIEEWTGPLYEPKTKTGKMTRTMVEMLPGAAFPAGGPVQRAMNVIGPSIGAEVGEAHAGPYGRLAGALTGGLVGARGLTPAPATPERRHLAQVLKNEGVPLTAGQKTGSMPLRWAEAVAGDTPFAAGKAARINEAQGRAFTGAALRRMGASGDELATSQTLNREVSRIGNQFETLSARNTLQADTQFGNDLVSTAQKYVDSVIPTQRAAGRQNIEAIMRDVVDELQRNGGTMSGELYQATRSRLGRMADGVSQSDPQLSHAIDGIKKALDSAMRRSISPQDRDAWDEARRQWGNWKVIERAATGAGAQTAEGYISPSQLRTAVAGQNRTKYATGKGDLAELARAGEALMKPLPQSGTAPRVAASNLMAVLAGLGGTAASGSAEVGIAAALAPSIAGRAVMSSPVQKYLGNQIMPNSPQNLPRLLALEGLLARPRAQ